MRVNSQLQKLGGMDAPINRDCQKWLKTNGLLDFGEIAVTSAGELKCKHIIHTVGAIAGEEDSDRDLERCIEQILDKADELGDVNTISIPPLSCGGIGFLEEECAEIMIRTCVKWFHKFGSSC